MHCSSKVWAVKAGFWGHTGTIGVLVLCTPFCVIMQKPWNHPQHADHPSDLSSSQPLITALTLESHRMLHNDVVHPATPNTPGPALQRGGPTLKGRLPRSWQKKTKCPGPARSRLRADKLYATRSGRSSALQPGSSSEPRSTHSAPWSPSGEDGPAERAS